MSIKEYLKNYVPLTESIKALKEGMEENRCVIPLRIAKAILRHYEPYRHYMISMKKLERGENEQRNQERAAQECKTLERNHRNTTEAV